MLENNGIVRTVPADLSRDSLRDGKNTQMVKAVGTHKIVILVYPCHHSGEHLDGPRTVRQKYYARLPEAKKPHDVALAGAEK
jgi:hypothetical protein